MGCRTLTCFWLGCFTLTLLILSCMVIPFDHGFSHQWRKGNARSEMCCIVLFCLCTDWPFALRTCCSVFHTVSIPTCGHSLFDHGFSPWWQKGNVRSKMYYTVLFCLCRDWPVSLRTCCAVFCTACLPSYSTAWSLPGFCWQLSLLLWFTTCCSASSEARPGRQQPLAHVQHCAVQYGMCLHVLGSGSQNLNFTTAI